MHGDGEMFIVMRRQIEGCLLSKHNHYSDKWKASQRWVPVSVTVNERIRNAKPLHPWHGVTCCHGTPTSVTLPRSYVNVTACMLHSLNIGEDHCLFKLHKTADASRLSFPTSSEGGKVRPGYVKAADFGLALKWYTWEHGTGHRMFHDDNTDRIITYEISHVVTRSYWSMSQKYSFITFLAVCAVVPDLSQITA